MCRWKDEIIEGLIHNNMEEIDFTNFVLYSD